MSDYETLIPSETVAHFSDVYSSEEITEVRKYMIDNAYKKKSNSKVELESKLKCGILSSDVVDYFVHENKDLVIYVNSNSEDEYDFDESTYAKNDQKSHQDQNVINASTPDFGFKSQPFENHCSLSFKLNQPVYFKKSKYHTINNQLTLNHKCKIKCKKDITSLMPNAIINHKRLAYVCDVCFKLFREQELALKHLDAFNHVSASEYLLEDRSQTKSLSSDHTLKYINNLLAESKLTIMHVTNRCSTKSLVFPHLTGVFCPKRGCQFYFKDSILACGLHYQYMHENDEQIYSIAQLKLETEFEITKLHTCPKCKELFSKLSDLTNHLFKTKHFPFAAENEINLFLCQIDDCKFRSTNFHSFKTHTLMHRLFKKPMYSVGTCYSKKMLKSYKPSLNLDPRVTVKVLTFHAPTGFLHFPKIKQSFQEDNKNEFEAIEDLLELNKGYLHVPGYSVLNARLLARLSELKELREK